jgi:two-component system, LytTR family, sensor kinase
VGHRGRAADLGDPLPRPSLGLAAALLLPPLIYWLLLLPVVLWLGIRFPLRRHTLLRSLPVHGGAAALLAAGYAELMVRVMGALIGDDAPAWAGSVADWPVRFQFGLLAYSFILSWGYVHEYFTALRDREVAVTRLQAELAQAQLRALKAQLQPHFLFNTLHAITLLIRHDAEDGGAARSGAVRADPPVHHREPGAHPGAPAHLQRRVRRPATHRRQAHAQSRL